MTAIAWLLVIAGVVAAGGGIYVAFERPRPWLGAVVAPAGVVMALVGALLLFVPGFFG